MLTRAPFLNTTYGAYYHRERPTADEELTRVGPGTPCGEYLRRFWQPVAFARELGAVPLAIRIMGEELVIFRDLRQRDVVRSGQRDDVVHDRPSMVIEERLSQRQQRRVGS